MTVSRQFTGTMNPVKIHSAAEGDPSASTRKTLFVNVNSLNPYKLDCDFGFDDGTPFNGDIGVTPRTQLDLNLQGMTAARYQAIRVIIVLLPQSFGFFDAARYNNDAQGTLLCLTTGNLYAQDKIRDLSIYETNAQGQITGIEFYVINNSTTSTDPYGQYNLKIWVKDKTSPSVFMMPLVYDPGIKNDG